MKKIFALAIALLAVANIATAQVNGDYVMNVTDVNGHVSQFGTDEVAEITFAPNTWKSYAGVYSYSIFFSEGSYSYTLWVDRETGIGRVDGYPAGDGFTFSIDADNNITVDEQTTEYYYSYYSSYICMDEANHYLSTHNVSGYSSVDYNSYYDPEADTYYFALAYYISAGYFGFSGDVYEDGYETFVVSNSGAPAHNNSGAEFVLKANSEVHAATLSAVE